MRRVTITLLALILVGWGQRLDAAVRVVISPSAVTMLAGTTQQFTAQVTGAGGNRTVVWSIAVNCGTVTQKGLYSAPVSAPPAPCRLQARHSSGQTGVVYITVTAPEPPEPDPIPPTPIPPTTPTGPFGYTFCVLEGAVCNFAGSQSVAYGALPTFVYRDLTGGTPCTNAVFGDPLPNVQKACFLKPSGTPPTPTPIPPPDSTAGPGATPCPAGLVDVPAGSDIQGAINAHNDGTQFCLGTGVHRLPAGLTPKNNDALIGAPGAVLSGAKVLIGFMPDGPDWVLGGQTMEGPIHGECDAAFPRCDRPEDLFLDDHPLHHVASRAALTAGAWFFDYGVDRVYMRDNPTGHLVEISTVPSAVRGSAVAVTLRNFRATKLASMPQFGGIDGETSSGWTVDHLRVDGVHGIGLRVGPGMHVTASILCDNGQMGIGGVGAGIIVETSEICRNNYAGVNVGWEAGGSKFVKTDGLILRNNKAHHNTGPGLWLDIDNINFTVDGNTGEDNGGPQQAASPCIYVEISYGGVVRNNVCRRNGLNFGAWAWGSCIIIAASGGAGLDVSGNLCADNGGGISLVQQTRGFGAFGPYLVQNVYVHDNHVSATKGYNGGVVDNGDNAMFTSRQNRFDRNIYVQNCTGPLWAWNSGERTWADWRTYGMDAMGSCTP